jgi:[ribosomal protein S18]-alanine N-acetyltransferase
MTMITIREVGADRVAAIMPIMDAAFDSRYGEAWTSGQCISSMSLPGTWMLLAEVDGKVAGFAIARSILDDAELMLIAVLPDMQASGLGSRLLRYVTAHARKNGAERLFVEVRQDNPALKFYGFHGFKKMGERKNYYRRLDGGTSDAITLALSLEKGDNKTG